MYITNITGTKYITDNEVGTQVGMLPIKIYDRQRSRIVDRYGN